MRSIPRFDNEQWTGMFTDAAKWKSTMAAARRECPVYRHEAFDAVMGLCQVARRSGRPQDVTQAHRAYEYVRRDLKGNLPNPGWSTFAMVTKGGIVVTTTKSKVWNLGTWIAAVTGKTGNVVLPIVAHPNDMAFSVSSTGNMPIAVADAFAARLAGYQDAEGVVGI